MEVLYYLSSPQTDVIEIKRSDSYQWLAIDKKRKSVWTLDFKSMHKEGTKEEREFLEGKLHFDFDSGSLKILGEDITLDRKYPQDAPASLLKLVTDHLDQKLDPQFRSLKPSDVGHFIEWVSDPEVIRYSMTKFHHLKTNHEITHWFYSTLRDEKSFQLAIIDPASQKIIGYAGISGINKLDGNGEFFIFIGDKSYWGQGVATEVTKKIIRVGFDELKLHRIFLTASSKNPGALRAYEKAGFQREGVMREAFFRNGEYSDKIIMGLLNPSSHS